MTDYDVVELLQEAEMLRDQNSALREFLIDLGVDPADSAYSDADE